MLYKVCYIEHNVKDERVCSPKSTALIFFVGTTPQRRCPIRGVCARGFYFFSLIPVDFTPLFSFSYAQPIRTNPQLTDSKCLINTLCGLDNFLNSCIIIGREFSAPT